MIHMIPPRKKLSKIFDDDTEASKFAYDQGFIFPISCCPEDGYSMKQIGSFQYRCRKKQHRKVYSSLKNSIFENMQVGFGDFFHLLYLWLCKVKFCSIEKITGHSSHTIKRIISLIEERICEHIFETNIKIGGPGVQVQVDESKFGKRKYNRGHHVEGAWVFGGVEITEARNFFAVIVEKRDAKTLNDLILKYVLPGSVLVTDGWKGYKKFKNNSNFSHKMVNHSISFKNSDCFNTNAIEGTWNGVKMNVPARCRIKKD